VIINNSLFEFRESQVQGHNPARDGWNSAVPFDFAQGRPYGTPVDYGSSFPALNCYPAVPTLSAIKA